MCIEVSLDQLSTDAHPFPGFVKLKSFVFLKTRHPGADRSNWEEVTSRAERCWICDRRCRESAVPLGTGLGKLVQTVQLRGLGPFLVFGIQFGVTEN